VLPALQGKTGTQRTILTTELEPHTDEEPFSPQPLYGRMDRLPISELRAALISLFINEFGATKTKREESAQWLLSRKLADALTALCQHWQTEAGEAKAYSVLGNVINQYFYAANADNSDQPINLAKIEQATRALEKAAMREPDDHQRLRLMRHYQDAALLTDALWAYFEQQGGGLKDVKTKEKLLDYVLELPRFHQTEENLEMLAQYLPELDCPNYQDLFLCFSRLPLEERTALEIKLGVLIEAGGVRHRDEPMGFINKKAKGAYYGVSAETLRQRFNSAARRLAHCLWDNTEEANDE